MWFDLSIIQTMYLTTDCEQRAFILHNLSVSEYTYDHKIVCYFILHHNSIQNKIQNIFV